MVALQGRGHNRVKAGDQWAKAFGRGSQPKRARANSSRRSGCSARAGTHATAEAADAATGSVLHDTSIDAKKIVGAAFRAQNFGVGNAEVVSRNSNVQVILYRQRYRVVHGQVELSVAHELINSRSVAEVWRLHVASCVRRNYVGKGAVRLGIVRDHELMGRRRRRCLRKAGLRGWRRAGLVLRLRILRDKACRERAQQRNCSQLAKYIS